MGGKMAIGSGSLLEIWSALDVGFLGPFLDQT
jgi:hypothetical protein